MVLSIIIVNFNVRLLLEQCLRSVQSAAHMFNRPLEVVVIDNNSSDGSVEHLRSKFPHYKFIANKENVGFAKACNQGIKTSSGQYVLFLNPDTMVKEDCFVKTIDAFEKNDRIGALGVQMVNGQGKYLPESKRGNPTTSAAFYKLFGLATLFPRSRRFARYYLGHLDKKSNHPVEVLSGAFMMVKRKILEEVGYFDEAFFMYGEDIDLSYRIQKAGYLNYYMGEVSIVHLKGQSTRKTGEKHISNFYRAMNIFVNKHYQHKSKTKRMLIHTGIWFRKRLAHARYLMMNFFGDTSGEA